MTDRAGKQEDYTLRRRNVGSREKTSPEAPSGTRTSIARESQDKERSQDGKPPPTVQLQDKKDKKQRIPRNVRMWKKMSGIFIQTKKVSDENIQPLQLKKQYDTTILERFWTTADMHRGDSAHMIFAMRDLIIYLLYLALLLFLMYGPRDYAQNYYATIMSDLITQTEFLSSIGSEVKVKETFYSIRTVDQLSEFVANILKPIWVSPAVISDSFPPGTSMLLESILIGAPAVRLLRVKNDTCQTAPMFEDVYKTCWDLYSPENEDKEPYGLPGSEESPWRYRNASIMDSAPHYGIFGTYPSGGFQFNMTPSIFLTWKWFYQLFRYEWVRKGTRFVTIDFTTYTPNTNLFCAAKLTFEVIPCGALIPRANFYTMKLYRWDEIPYSEGSYTPVEWDY